MNCRMLRGVLAWVAVAVVTAGLENGLVKPAHAYDFYVNSQTIGQGYQLRAGDGTLLDRRRLTEYVRLGIFGLLDDDAPNPQRRGSPSDKATIGFVASFRFDTDFGLKDTEIKLTPQLDGYSNAFTLLYAYFYGRNFFHGWFEWEVGRQFIIDQNDWYSFDGATLRLVTPAFFAVEAFGGIQVKDTGPVGSNVFMLDGTAISPDNPFSKQDNAVSPVFGFALMSRGLRFLETRLAYRRTASVTEDEVLQALASPANAAGGVGRTAAPCCTVPANANSGVEEEKISYSATIFPYYPKTTIRITGGVRYNLLLGTFDDIRAGGEFQFLPQHAIGVEYYRIRPDFAGDSIWNVFSTQAMEDLHGRYSWKPTRFWEVSARGTVRFYESVFPPVSFNAATTPPTPAPDNGGQKVQEYGGGIGTRYWKGLTQMRGEFNWVTGYGGHRGGVDLSGRYPLWGERIRIEGRLNWVNYEDDLRNPAPAGTQSFDASGNSFGAQAGGTWVIYPGILLHLLAEENVNTVYSSQLRLLALLDLSAWR